MRQKKTLIPALMALAACQPMAGPSGEPSPPDAAPPGWTRHTLSTGFGEAPGYSVALPAGLEQRSVQGIDSEVARFEGDSLKISFDYGRYGNLGTCLSGWSCRDGTTVVDGRSASTRAVDKGASQDESGLAHRYAAYVRVTDDVGLAVQADCADASACERAAAIVRSVDFAG